MIAEQLAELVDHEFNLQCPKCTTADWYVWASHHGTNHREMSAPACDMHHDLIEQCTLHRLREGWVCSCGFALKGQLSDHFRSVRL